MGKNQCATKETSAWEESLHGENESYGILPFSSEAKAGQVLSEIFSNLCNPELWIIRYDSKLAPFVCFNLTDTVSFLRKNLHPVCHHVSCSFDLLQFPEDWPCGSPDQTRALLNRLTHKGLDHAQRCQSEVFLAEQEAETTTELGKKPALNIWRKHLKLEVGESVEVMRTDDIDMWVRKILNSWETAQELAGSDFVRAI